MNKLRIAPEPDEAEVAVGDQITVNYRGTWYPGTIVRAGDGDDGYYDVRYNDGSGWVEQNVDVSRLRALAVGAGAGPPGGPPGGPPAEGGAESAPEAYTICVRALSGESTTLEVDGADTIATVKKKFDAALLESDQEPMKGLSLWHENARLDETRTLQSYGVGAGTVLQAVTKRHDVEVELREECDVEEWARALAAGDTLMMVVIGGFRMERSFCLLYTSPSPRD